MQVFYREKILNIIPDISPKDLMLQCGSKEHYYNVGKSALDCIMLVLYAADKNPEEIKKILDLPLDTVEYLNL